MAESTDPSHPTPGPTPDDLWAGSHDRAFTPGEEFTGQVGNYDDTEEMEAIGTPFDEGEPDPDAALDDDPSNSLETENASEALSDERFWEIIHGSEYLVSAEGGSGREEITNSDYSAPRKSFFGVSEPLGRAAETAFVKAGVSEVVTITPVADLELTGSDTKRFRQREGREPLAVVEYTTLSGDKYPYTDYRVEEDRPPEAQGKQTSLRWTMILPQSEADELRGAIVEDPDLVRLMSEALVTNPEARVAPPWQRDNPITRELWEACRPDYAGWRDINGGVDRIALRDGQFQPPDGARILEFRAE